jgi:hypothetical protein
LIAQGIERARDATWEKMVKAMRGHMLSAIQARRAASPQPLIA